MTRILASLARDHYDRHPTDIIFVCGTFDQQERRWYKLRVGRNGDYILQEPIPNIGEHLIERWLFNRLHRAKHKWPWWDKDEIMEEIKPSTRLAQCDYNVIRCTGTIALDGSYTAEQLRRLADESDRFVTEYREKTAPDLDSLMQHGCGSRLQ